MTSTLITVESIDSFVFPTTTRFPFRYGIACMTQAPHLFLRTRLSAGGVAGVGVASEGLPPKWFTKDPATSFEEDLPDLFGVVEHASSIATGASGSFFDIWRLVYEEQHRWAAARAPAIPPLLANLGVSLVERSILDALCRASGTTIARAVAENRLGIRLGDIHPELAGRAPADCLPRQPLDGITVRHTVGLADPLNAADVGEPLDDGLPHALEECIAAYGLDHFKIKLSGEFDRDRDRLARIHALLSRALPGGYRLSVDGNEQFRDIGAFRDQWERLREDRPIRDLLARLLFVEQPLHRERALDGEVASAIGAWPDAPPLVIDESDAALESLPRALELGYSGTSHKNCKGIVKGIANACLLEHRRRARPARPLLLSGEDLGNIGPVALLQDLAMMALLGIPHVERNGHHYFRGLSMFPARVQDAVLSQHGDLYRRHERGFATLRIENGRIRIASLLAAPFGAAALIEPDCLSLAPGTG